MRYIKLTDATKEDLILYCKQNNIYCDDTNSKITIIYLIRSDKGNINTISFNEGTK